MIAKQPRPYQLDCFAAIRDAYKRGLKHVIVELPTGTGKTVIFTLITKMVREKGTGRVLIVVNRDVLINQAIEELHRNGIFAQAEKGSHKATTMADVVVGSIQSMQGKRLEKWPRDFYKMVICDECHGSGSSTFKSTLAHFESAYHLGVTATPERHDKKGLWQGYEEIVYRMSLYSHKATDGEEIIGAIDDGWLCGFDFHELDCPVTIDEKIAKKAIIGEDEEVFDSAKYLPRLALEAVKGADGRKSLFFLTNCRTSNMFAELLRRQGVDARHVDSTYMTAQETTDTLEWFANSPNGILTNAQLLTTGYNQPDIQAIGMFRPMASTPLYKQMLGRGTRAIAPIDNCDSREGRLAAIAASAKPNCRVLNVFWENGSHDLAAPSCLITDDPDEQKAINAATKGKQLEIGEIKEQLIAKRMADQEEEARKFAEQVANSQRKKSRGAQYIADILRHRNPAHKPASDAFIQYVRRLGADIPPGDYSAYQIMRIKERIQKQKAGV